MLDPIILSDAILDQARVLRDACLQRWTERGEFPQIGAETLVSPVDGTSRKVVLHLGSGFRVKAQTCVGIRASTGQVIGEGYTVVLNRGLIDRAAPLVHILLHELTHTVDPCFDDDFSRLNPTGTQTARLSSLEQYYLPSEQRAFSAMWIADLREDLARDVYSNPAVSITRYCQLSAEFKGFWDNTPDLAEQTKEHFRRMVEDLRKR
jgi:hypothetical protein